MKASDALDRVIDVYVDRPYHCFGGCCGLLLALVGLSVGTGSMNMTLDQETAWRVHHGEFTQAMAGFKQSRDRMTQTSTDGGNGGNGGNGDEKPKDLILMYKATGSTIFTPGQLQDMCRLETTLVKTKAAICPQTGGSARGNCPAYSAVHTFYGDIFQALNESCPLLSQASVDATVAQIAADTAIYGSSSMYAWLVTPAFLGTNVSLYTRSAFSILSNSSKPVEDTEKYMLDEFLSQMDPPLKYGFLRSPFLGEEDQFVKFGSVRMRYYYPFDEFGRMVPGDFSFAICSIFFVFVTMWLHLGSCFLACFGMWQIVASLPIGAIIYRQIFRIEYFEFLHILVVYLVLGVGADDVFVLLDSWRHIKAEYGIQWGKGNVSRETLHRALRETWMRTTGAIFNTSFTTAVAFMSMSISKVMPMKTCGWFAAVCVALCFIFTITFTPACLMVYQLHFGGKRCCCPNPAQPAPQQQQVGDEKAEGQPRSQGGGCFSGCIERMLMKYYLPMMQKKVGPVKPVPLTFVLVMLGVMAQGIYFSMQLTPPSKPEEWFPANHMWIGITQFISDTYYSPDHERYSKTWFVWGLSDMNFEPFNEYKPDDFPPQVQYDSTFDLSTTEAQQAFLDTCQAVRVLGCTLPGCKGSRTDFVLKYGSQPVVSCVLEDFQRWLRARHNMNTMPTGATFTRLIGEFRDQANPNVYGDNLGGALTPNYRKNLGFQYGQLVHAAIEVRSTMLDEEPYGSGSDVRAMVDAFAKEKRAAMPASMQSLRVASNPFANFDLGQELVSGLFSGMAIAGPLVFAVLLFSTRNIVLAIYAVVSVIGIVVSVLGFCKSAMDYDLGVGEAIAGIIVIGYSVDYVVHFAHTYCEAARLGKKTREERAAFTIQNMGSTVFAGAITTAGSGIFMFFCYLTFFAKMALLICMTIFYSFLFALCLFMGLCFLIGPEGTFGDICCCLPSSSSRPKGEAVDDKPKDMPGGSSKDGIAYV